MPPFIPWRRRFGAKSKSRRYAGTRRPGAPTIVVGRIVTLSAPRPPPPSNAGDSDDDDSDDEGEPQIFTHAKYGKRCDACKRKFRPDHWLKKLRCDHVFHLKCAEGLAQRNARCVTCFPPSPPPPPPPVPEVTLPPPVPPVPPIAVLPVSFPNEREREELKIKKAEAAREAALAAARAEYSDSSSSSETASSSSESEEEEDDGSQVFTHTKYDPQCSICLKHYRVGHWLKKLWCAHAFHEACIDAWLPINNKCPLCRDDVAAADV